MKTGCRAPRLNCRAVRTRDKRFLIHYIPPTQLPLALVRSGLSRALSRNDMRKVIYFFGLLAITYAIVVLCGWFSRQQQTSIAVFATFIYGTLMFGEFRLAFAFGGIAVLLAANLMSVEQFVISASLDVIVFLIGTFLVIGFLEENQFFEHVVAALVKWVGPRPQALLAAMMFMGSISSCLVGEVTAILFMAGTLLHLTTKYKLNPVPFVIMLVFACNIGSAMSSVGNPIGVLIALKTGLSFTDFLKWAAPVALVVNGVVYLICRWWYADSFAQFGEAVKQQYAETSTAGAQDSFEDDSDSQDSPSQLLSWIVLIGLIGLLVTHGVTERALGHLVGAVRETLPDGTIVYGLKEGTMMVAAALIMGCIVLLIRRERARELVERRVDWWTLAFFMMLFASVGTLEHTGVTRVIADKVGTTFKSPTALVQVVGWSTGWLSAFLDNVLAVATFMPVVHDIRMRAAPEPFSSSIYWMMLFGGTFMGNMTIIGSTANIVACGLLEKRGHGVVRFGQWFKIGFIVSIASMLVAAGLLWAMDRTFGIPMLLPPTIEGVASPH
jgi:Na+/H+ antiporter NhaD/arsenite permease-like protein